MRRISFVAIFISAWAFCAQANAAQSGYAIIVNDSPGLTIFYLCHCDGNNGPDLFPYYENRAGRFSKVVEAYQEGKNLKISLEKYCMMVKKDGKGNDKALVDDIIKLIKGNFKGIKFTLFAGGIDSRSFKAISEHLGCRMRSGISSAED